ncbi:hypothetical protein LWI29_023556 [Acer saccharum]|uniref:Protein kinase domain-containing protein n=1 Tax=Acer saccharum TaxID=4024 RepID=A0AA39T790_ACESA|nr:hypothetical protein LWI29_023556 [Acer saccharum]
MGSHQRSFFTELNPSSSTTSKDLCTSSNHSSNIEFPASYSTEVVHEEENPMAQMWRTPSLKEFSFKDLIIASMNFSPDSLLCEGGFGRVYKGWVDEKTLAPSSIRGIGMAVAIKELPYHYLGIYGSKLPLERVEHYNAKLLDFGLAMLGPSTEEVPVSTGYAFGTIGYIAPEYITTGDLYLKSDVYGFGVMLLELLMGLRVTDPEHPRGEQNLVDWLKPILSQETKLKTIMDAQMEGQYSSEAALQAAQLSLSSFTPKPWIFSQNSYRRSSPVTRPTPLVSRRSSSDARSLLACATAALISLFRLLGLLN